MATDNEILNYITQSFELKNQGYYKPAIEMLYKALTIENNNIEILSQLSELYYLLKNNKRAIDYIEKVLEIDSTHIDSLKLLIKICEEEKDYTKAKEASDKIFSLNPSQENLIIKLRLINKTSNFKELESIEKYDIETNDKILYELAKAYYQTSNFKKAIEYLEKAKEINSNNLEIIDLLAKIYFQTNNFEKSKELFEFLEKKEQSPDIINHLGLFMLENMNFEKAINYFAEAFRLEPQNATYAFNLAHTYFLNGWTDEAIKYFNLAICLDEGNEDYRYMLAYVYYQNEKYNKALMEIALQKEHHVQSQMLAAMIKTKQGDLINAKLELEKISQANTNDEYLLFSLAKVYLELNLLEKACDTIEKVIAINPNSLNYMSEFADILIQLKHNEKAQEIIDKIIAKNENYIPGLILQAKNSLAIKEFQTAFDFAQKIIDLDANISEGYYYNAITLFQQGDVNFAIESLKKAISLDVNRADYYVTMSEFYQELGQYENALTYIKEACDIDPCVKNKNIYTSLASIVRKLKVNYKQ